MSHKRFEVLQQLSADFKEARARQKDAEARAEKATSDEDKKKALNDAAAAKSQATNVEKALSNLEMGLKAKRSSLIVTNGENDPAVEENDRMLAIIENLHLGPVSINRLVVPKRFIPTAAGEVSSAVFSARGENLFVADWGGSVYSYDFATGKVRFTIAAGKSAENRFLAVSPDDRYLVSVGAGSTIQLIDHGKIQKIIKGKCTPYYAVAFSPDGKTLAAGGCRPDGGGGLLELWDLGSDQVRSIEFPFAIRSLAFPPNANKWLAVGTEGANVGMFNLATDKVEYTIHQPGPTRALAFSPNGHWLAAAAGEGQVRLSFGSGNWRVAMHRGNSTLTGHVGHVTSIQFSPDGERVVTAGTDGTAKLWDVATGKLAGTLAPGTYKRGMGVALFTPDGRSLLTAGDDLFLRIWGLNSIAGRATGRLPRGAGMPAPSDAPIPGDLFRNRTESKQPAAGPRP